ncbi:Vacuolar protein-sorting-associated protein 25 [Cichlidogyrus casuarinus]|uniref:Vacuolar protein-sorting-associated protein 25 n=1 Tax=Cichlidogyrus casuarinus TaxID=1844966 RepID=A0ABD2Q276_9PLAT
MIRIERKASKELVIAVLDELHRRGNLTWTNKTHTEGKFAWKTPEEWAKIIADWAISTGQGNNVFTIFELISGDETVDEPFHGLDHEVFITALRCLERQDRAKLMNNNDGVKFFLV